MKMEIDSQKDVIISIVVSKDVAEWLKAKGLEQFRSMRGQTAAIVMDAYRAEKGVENAAN